MFVSIFVAAAAAAAPQWVPLNSQQAKQDQGQMVVQTPTVNPTVSAPAPSGSDQISQAVAQAAVARMLPAGTLVSLTPLEELSSKHIKEGQRFQFTVVNDVVEKGYVVIPRGSTATGVVTMQTGRGIVGKSGKFEVTFESVNANGVTFPLSGVHRQEGKGNTVGALLGSMWISGHSAVMLPGEVVTAFVKANTAY